jgi:hypothetical protein
MGFEPEDYETDPVELWPENWLAWDIFTCVSTQWRTGGMGSYVGLDYGPMFVLMEKRGLKKQEWLEVFDDVRVIEAQALETIGAQDGG